MTIAAIFLILGPIAILTVSFYFLPIDLHLNGFYCKDVHRFTGCTPMIVEVPDVLEYSFLTVKVMVWDAVHYNV